MKHFLHLFFTLSGTIVILFTGFLLILHPAAVSSGAATGLLRCTELLLPSLFPFLVFSSFLIHSGVADRIGRRTGQLLPRLFRLPACAATTLLTGLTGGYPVGARGVRSLYEAGRLSDGQAHRMLLFCIGAGPGFLVSAIGEQMLHSRTAGLLLFAAQILAALLLGLLSTRFVACSPDSSPAVSPGTKAPAPPSFSSALVSSVADASRAMLSLGSFVVLFSALFSLLSACGILTGLQNFFRTLAVPSGIASALFPVFWEVSGGVYAAADAVPFSPFLLGFSVGWGGLCTHFQLFSAAGPVSVPHGQFFLFRILHGLLTGSFTAFFFSLLPEDSITVSSLLNPPKVVLQIHSFSLTAALLTLCLVFLLATRQNLTENSVFCPPNTHRI